MRTNAIIRRLGFSALLAMGLILPEPVFAHCDGIDGPVVQAARKALDSGNVNLVLIWVRKDDEGEIKRAFDETIAVSKTGPASQETRRHVFL